MNALCVLLALLALAEGQVDNATTEQVTIHYTEPPAVETSTLGINGYPGFKELPGGRIKGQRILDISKSPYLVREDLYIEKSGELIVEPGVEIRFAPMIGITVRGVITAKVNNTIYSRGEVSFCNFYYSYSNALSCMFWTIIDGI